MGEARLFKGKSAAWTACLTFAMTVFSGVLWHVSDESNANSITTQRAFLAFGGVNVTKGDSIDCKTPGYNFFGGLGNSGTTPTKRAVYEISPALQDSPPSETTNWDNLPDTDRVPYVLGPKNGVQAAPMFISLADMEAVAAGRKHLFIWGVAVYRDIYASIPIRLSEMCVEVTNPTWTAVDHGDPKTEMNLILPPCKVHNCYDKDCADYEQ